MIRSMILIALLMPAIAMASNHTLEIRSGNTEISYGGDLASVDQFASFGHVNFYGDGSFTESPAPGATVSAADMQPTGDWSASILLPKVGWTFVEGCKLVSITILADHSHIKLACPD